MINNAYKYRSAGISMKKEITKDKKVSNRIATNKSSAADDVKDKAHYDRSGLRAIIKNATFISHFAGKSSLAKQNNGKRWSVC